MVLIQIDIDCKSEDTGGGSGMELSIKETIEDLEGDSGQCQAEAISSEPLKELLLSLGEVTVDWEDNQNNQVDTSDSNEECEQLSGSSQPAAILIKTEEDRDQGDDRHVRVSALQDVVNDRENTLSTVHSVIDDDQEIMLCECPAVSESEDKEITGVLPLQLTLPDPLHVHGQEQSNPHGPRVFAEQCLDQQSLEEMSPEFSAISETEDKKGTTVLHLQRILPYDWPGLEQSNPHGPRMFDEQCLHAKSNEMQKGSSMPKRPRTIHNPTLIRFPERKFMNRSVTEWWVNSVRVHPRKSGEIVCSSADGIHSTSSGAVSCPESPSAQSAETLNQDLSILRPNSAESVIEVAPFSPGVKQKHKKNDQRIGTEEPVVIVSDDEESLLSINVSNTLAKRRNDTIVISDESDEDLPFIEISADKDGESSGILRKPNSPETSKPDTDKKTPTGTSHGNVLEFPSVKPNNRKHERSPCQQTKIPESVMDHLSPKGCKVSPQWENVHVVDLQTDVDRSIHTHNASACNIDEREGQLATVEFNESRKLWDIVRKGERHGSSQSPQESSCQNGIPRSQPFPGHCTSVEPKYWWLKEPSKSQDASTVEGEDVLSHRKKRDGRQKRKRSVSGAVSSDKRKEVTSSRSLKEIGEGKKHEGRWKRTRSTSSDVSSDEPKEEASSTCPSKNQEVKKYEHFVSQTFFKDVAAEFNLQQDVKEKAEAMFHKICLEKLKYWIPEQCAAACVCFASRQVGNPCTFTELADFIGHPKQSIGKCYKMILKKLGLSSQYVSYKDYVHKYSSKMGLVEEDEKRAVEIAGKLHGCTADRKRWGNIKSISPLRAAALGVFLAANSTSSKTGKIFSIKTLEGATDQRLLFSSLTILFTVSITDDKMVRFENDLGLDLVVERRCLRDFL